MKLGKWLLDFIHHIDRKRFRRITPWREEKDISSRRAAENAKIKNKLKIKALYLFALLASLRDNTFFLMKSKER